LQGSAPATANTASTIALRDANGNLSANFFIGNGSQLTGITSSSSTISNGNSNVSIATSNGNITMSAVGNANVVVITGTGANINGYANITGNITFTGANVSLGNVSNLHITGGTSSQVLTTDGAGTLSWSTPSTTALTVDSFTGNGVRTTFTLTATPISTSYVFLSVGGVSQPRSTYSLSGNTVTISSAPPNNAAVEFTSITGGSGTGGGGSGNSSTSAIFSLPNTVTSNTTLASGNNAMSVGPITVNTGISVTVPSGQRWVIL
jgi:hypothetical protein